MKLATTLLVLCGILLGLPGMEPRANAASGPRMEIAFALDATGSMGPLIAGAKQKIWTIVNRVVAGTPTPSIRLGLLGYRDRSDEYVTRRYDLTDDLDDLYGHLLGLRAAGGGDFPESVNQALHEAVTQLAWTTDPGSLKIVFLVGDAPPHTDYADDVPVAETIRLAKRSGIVINTIQCGTNAAATQAFQEIAALAGGEFVQIEQSGGMLQTSTPHDSELSRLSAELARTVVPYGDAATRVSVQSKADRAADASTERVLVMNVDRAEFGAKVVVTGEGELIWDVVNHKVNLEEIDAAALPANMKQMTIEERKAFVDEQFTKRKDIQTRVDALSTQRAAYLRTEMAKTAQKPDSFDNRVAEMIRAQAMRQGIEYDASIASPAAP